MTGERKSLFLAEGLGHGFMALTDDATVLYLCSTGYAPGREHGLNPMDRGLGIEWPLDEIDGVPILSAKDADAPSLGEAEAAGLFPATRTASPTPSTCAPSADLSHAS